MKIKENIAISSNGFIFNPSTGDSFSVNPIGVKIMELLKKEKREAEIRKEICSTYHTDADTFDKDFYDFINMLKQYQIVEAIIK